MRNKLLIGVLCAVMLLGTIAGAITVGYAWLSPGKTVPVVADGSAIASYFYDGEGTEDDPYILTNAKHVYNLAWLQYMGVFNETNDEGELAQQYFFELANNINMATAVNNTFYQIIPPIGTLENPFVGHFDAGEKDADGNYVKDANGNIKCYSISNAIVANYITPGEDNNITVDGKGANIVEHPPSVDEVRNAEIIGFFGVIGTYQEADANNTPTGTTPPLTLSSEGGDNSQLAMVGVSNLILHNITIVTEPYTVENAEKYSLIGLFAGFVNGTISNIKVSSGTIAVSQGVGPYSTLLYDSSTTKDEAGNDIATPPFSLNVTRSVSKYTLIGDYMTTRIDWAGGPLTGPTTDSGVGQGFGGSIDMLTLAKRLTYMMNLGTSSSSNYYSLLSNVANNNHAVVGIYNQTFDYEKTATQVLFMGQGTYLPLNIDTAGLDQSKYTTSSVEPVLSENTGFIVGKYSVPFRTQPLSLRNKLVGQLCNSMQGGSSSAGAWKTLQYTDAINGQLQILTKDVDGNYYVIGDNVNKLTSQSSPYTIYSNAGIGVKTYAQLGLTQYDGSTANRVRTKLGDMLKGNSSLYGLYFSSAKPTASSVTTFSAGSEVTLGGTEVSSLVQDSVHFVVKNDGVITLVAATVATDDNYVAGEWQSNRVPVTYALSYRLPALYQVIRDDDNDDDIDRLVEISVICKDNTLGTISYNDTLQDGKAPAGKTLLYNAETMGRLTTYGTEQRDLACMQSLFYFEIPVTKGEYVFGSTGVSNNYSFLLYLDIGANAGTQGSTGDGENDGNKPDYDGEISGVYFVDSNGNPIVQFTNENGTPGAAVAFDITTSNTNGTSVSFVGKDSTTVTVDKGQNTNTTVTLVEKKKEETDGS